jgi:pimeloyl-ACP methyl ester carboxylesterase
MAIVPPETQWPVVQSPAEAGSQDPGAAAAGRSTTLRPGGGLWRSWLSAAGLAVVSGLVVAWLAPRAPVTAAHALGLIALALVTGGVAGLVSRSRWAMLLAPVAHLAAFELARFGVVGPTVGALRLDGMFQVLAFLSGRGVYALLALLPMALGASLGAALARRHLHGPRPRRGALASIWLGARRVTTGATAGCLLALAWGLAQPPHTAPILGNALLLSYYEVLAPYTPPAEYVERVRAAGTGFLGTMAPEYSLMDKVNLARGLLDTSGVLYPRIQDLDFRRDVPRLEVPIYVIGGRYELPGRAVLVPEWLDRLQAPRKQLVTFGQSAHAPHTQEASRFREFMTGTVLPETRLPVAEP